MKKIIFLATVSFCLNLHAEDLFFSCKGKLTKEYIGKTSQRPIEIKENIGLIVKKSEVILSPSESIMKKPIQYSSNKVEARYNFPVCSRENHKILFNNFACNYEKTFNDLKISKSQVDLFEGSLDGISKKLVITIRPANEKIDALNRLKSGFYTIETGGYECLQIQPSF